MTTFLLIRHGITDMVGRRIAGSMPGVHLSPEGQTQAEGLPDRLAGATLDALYSSPLERCRETAAPLAARFGLEVRLAEELTEIGFGDWTGEMVEDLDRQALWSRFNAFRSGTRAPNGEMMLETQARTVAFLQRLHDDGPGRTIAVVSHADVIRAAAMYYLGIPMDFFQRLEISPASVTVLTLDDRRPNLLCLNHTGPLPLR